MPQTKSVFVSEANGGKQSWRSQRLDFVLQPMAESFEVVLQNITKSLSFDEGSETLMALPSYPDMLKLLRTINKVHPGASHLKL